jgi:hypothetical protein
MPNSSSGSEASAIEEAYADEVKGLFKILFTNLIDAPAADQQSAARFAAGLNRAKRARELALAAIETPSSQARALRGPKRSRKRGHRGNPVLPPLDARVYAPRLRLRVPLQTDR